MENGVGLKVTQKTNYPWDGNVEITVTPAEASEFTFFLRIPGWADRVQVTVNAKAVAGVAPGAYLPIRRRWSAGDVIQLKIEIMPQFIEANPRVADDTGRVAIQRGPLIYCLEEIDQPSGTSSATLRSIRDASQCNNFRANSEKIYSVACWFCTTPAQFMNGERRRRTFTGSMEEKRKPAAFR